jgi:hypothetical protein
MRFDMSRIAALLLALLLATPAMAHDSSDQWSPQDTEEWRQAQRYAQEGAEKLMQSFDMMLKAMPYGLPHMDGEGNIIIPRQHPRAAPGERSWVDRGPELARH